MTEVNLGTLSKLQWFSLIWAFLWRGLIITLGSGITGGIIGFMFGFSIGILSSVAGIDAEAVKLFVQIISGLLGIIVSFVFIMLWIKWLFRARFNKFRLALVSLDENAY